jgi:hypothetical protein
VAVEASPDPAADDAATAELAAEEGTAEPVAAAAKPARRTKSAKGSTS